MKIGHFKYLFKYVHLIFTDVDEEMHRFFDGGQEQI